MSAYFYDRRRHFVSFFPFFNRQMTAATNSCSYELEVYWSHTPDVFKPGCGKCGTTCALAMSCILSNLQEHVKSNMAAAAILLAFIPSILALLGPSFEETTPFLLSRPLFASCLLFATPAISPTSIFTLSSSSNTVPDNNFGVRSRVMRKTLTWMYDEIHSNSARSRSWKYISMIAIGLIECTIVSLAFYNVLRVTMLLDLKTRVVWRCGMSGQILLWILLGVPVRWFCAIGHVLPRIWPRLPWMTRSSSNRPISVGSASDSHEPEQTVEDAHTVTGSTVQLTPSWSKARDLTPIMHFLSDAFWAEITPSFFGSNHRVKDIISEGTLSSEISYWVASIMAIAHYGYGTLLFSSLLFISVNDAGEVMAWYAVSIFICRVVLLFELECMKFQWSKSNGDPMTERMVVPNASGRDDSLQGSNGYESIPMAARTNSSGG